MPRTHSVKLPDGTVATRQSDRLYKYAIVHVRTREEVDLEIKKLDAQVANAQHEVESLERRQSAADDAEYEVALRDNEYLEEKVVEKNKAGERVEVQRWLSDEYRRSIGEPEDAPYRTPGGALDRKLSASNRLHATVKQKLFYARQTLENQLAKRERVKALPVHDVDASIWPPGSCTCQSWSQSLQGAQKLVDDWRKSHPGGHVYFTNEIEVQEPKAKDPSAKPRKSARVHMIVYQGSKVLCDGKSWVRRRGTPDKSKVTCPDCLAVLDEIETTEATKGMQ